MARSPGEPSGCSGPTARASRRSSTRCWASTRPLRGTVRVFGHDVRRDVRARARAGRLHARERCLHRGHERGARSCATWRSCPACLPRRRSNARTRRCSTWGSARRATASSRTYSLGMKQLAKLAQAIAHGPRSALPGRADQRARSARARADDPPHPRHSGARRLHVVFSSHLLRDVEETCDEVIVLKEGRIAALRDLEEERRTNRRFLELEARGDAQGVRGRAVRGPGLRVRPAGRRPREDGPAAKGSRVRDLYRLAAEASVQHPAPELPARLRWRTSS